MKIEQLNLFPVINRKKKCVHTEHCCIIHGCKYFDPDCPVENDTKDQSYACDSCYSDEYELFFIIPERIKNLIDESTKRRERKIYIDPKSLRNGWFGY